METAVTVFAWIGVIWTACMLIAAGAAIYLSRRP